MNEEGRLLLLNAIAYISRFTEDCPIATTPSVFAVPVARPRKAIARYLRNPDYKVEWVRDIMVPELWTKLSPLSREKMTEWFEQNELFLHPEGSHRVVPLGQSSMKRLIQLEIDDDLAALGLPFDKPEFFDKTLADLCVGGTAAERARRLLDRYVPVGPRNDSAEQWTAWWRENKPYAFASDAGDYCWYIDPLAKKRGVPTSELRGPKRSDTMKVTLSR